MSPLQEKLSRIVMYESCRGNVLIIWLSATKILHIKIVRILRFTTQSETAPQAAPKTQPIKASPSILFI